MEKYLKVLKKCPLFEGIEDENLLKMLHCLGARVLTFEKHQIIFGEGASAKYIGIVLSGAVQVFQVDYYGNRSIFSNLCASEIFAEAYACSALENLPVSIEASEAACVMLIEAAHVLYTCHSNCGFHQRLIYNLMRDLAEKTLLFHERIDITSRRTTREKLLAYLTAYSRSEGRESFEIPFDRQELADYLEVERSGLSSEIGKLRREGVLESHRKYFRLISLNR